MFFNKNKKIDELRARFQQIYVVAKNDSFLKKNQFLSSYQKFFKTHRRKRRKMEQLIESITRSNAYEIEREMEEYFDYVNSLNDAIKHFDDKILNIDIVNEKIRNEAPLSQAKIEKEELKMIVRTMTKKCLVSKDNINIQIHLIAENPDNISIIKYQDANSLYDEFRQNIKATELAEKGKKQKEFEERQKAKTLEIARFKELEEKRLDQDRDRQIVEAKEVFKRNIAEKEKEREKHLAKKRKEFDLKHEELKKKEELIGEFLNQRQKEMLDELIEQKDDIINQIADQRASEILKKLGIKL